MDEGVDQPGSATLGPYTPHLTTPPADNHSGYSSPSTIATISYLPSTIHSVVVRLSTAMYIGQGCRAVRVARV